jgi:hypothetical protein
MYIEQLLVVCFTTLLNHQTQAWESKNRYPTSPPAFSFVAVCLCSLYSISFVVESYGVPAKHKALNGDFLSALTYGDNKDYEYGLAGKCTLPFQNALFLM